MPAPISVVRIRPLLAERRLGTTLLEVLFGDNRTVRFRVLSRDPAAVRAVADEAVGAMWSSEAVLAIHGPEPHHEAEDLIRGIQAIAAQRG